MDGASQPAQWGHDHDGAASDHQVEASAPEVRPNTADGAASAPEFAVDSKPKKQRNLAARSLLGSVIIFLMTGFVCAGLSRRAGEPVAFYGCMFAALLAFVGASGSVVRIVRIVRRSRTGSVPLSVLTLIVSMVMVLVGWTAAWMSVAEVHRGRQLRRFGRVRLPPVRNGSAWAKAAPRPASIPESIADALASQWRENGRTEHASVAAFAHVAIDLMALGAPPELIASTNQDALDEIRHTELCFSLARAIDGQALEPGPFLAARQRGSSLFGRRVALARLAVDSLIDGALHEGVSARIIARLAKRCEDESIRAMLKEIAADEGRHAAHGWDVVAWCVREGGTSVLDALAGALQVLPDRMESPLPFEAKEGAWERWGIHGHALEAEEYAAARAGLVRRVQTMMKSQPFGSSAHAAA